MTLEFICRSEEEEAEVRKAMLDAHNARTGRRLKEFHPPFYSVDVESGDHTINVFASIGYTFSIKEAKRLQMQLAEAIAVAEANERTDGEDSYFLTVLRGRKA